MDEPLQLTNATTTESLLELGSVLDSSLNDWNKELSPRNFLQDQAKHMRRSMAARCEKMQSPSLGLTIPQNHLNVMQNSKRRVKKYLLLALTLQRRQWSQKL